MFRIETIFKKTDKMNLIYKLKKNGATNIEFQTIFKYNNIFEKILLISEYYYLNLIKEIIFKNTDSTNILTFHLENESLNKKITSISIGNQQKIQTCRIIEYYFQNKVLRIKPFEEDITEISKKNKYPKNNIKIQIINAWKKNNKL